MYRNTMVFSRDAATLYERVSVRWSVGWSVDRSVTLSFFGLLGATNAVYTAPLLVGLLLPPLPYLCPPFTRLPLCL